MKKAFFLAAPVMFALVLASGATLATGCGGGSGGGTGGGSGGGAGGGTGGGSSDPNFTCDATQNAETSTTVYTKVVQAQCLSCHGTGAPYVAYGDYSTAAKLYTEVNKTSGLAPSMKVVVPNDLANSTMWVKLQCMMGTTSCKAPNGTACGAAMPYQLSSLSATDLKVFKDWICKGAPQ